MYNTYSMYVYLYAPVFLLDKITAFLVAKVKKQVRAKLLIRPESFAAGWATQFQKRKDGVNLDHLLYSRSQILNIVNTQYLKGSLYLLVIIPSWLGI